jgi:vancomycin resistance protein YoaR
MARKSHLGRTPFYKAAAVIAAISLLAPAPMAAFAEPQDTPVAAEAGEAAEAPSAAVAEEGNPGATPAPEAQAGDSNDAAPAQDGEAGEPGGEASADTADATDEAASGAAEGDPAAEVTGEAATEAPADDKKSSSHTLEEALALVFDDHDRIAYGSVIGGIDIGGMTVEEAEAAVNGYYQGIAESDFTINVNHTPVSVNVSTLDYKWTYGNEIKEAAKIGKSGGLVSRYREIADNLCDGFVKDVETSVNPDAVNAFVAERLVPLNVDPQNASIRREDGAFVITPEVYGVTLNQEATVNGIVDNFASETPDTSIDAVAEITSPAIVSEQLATIQSELGKYSTPIRDGSYGRLTNIKVASGRLNGRVLMPGEQLSVSKTILPRTTENGYKKGIQFNNGNNEEAIGGGVCQVSTTLYGALLRAELQIDERHPHSMVISYSPYSSDAAIASGSKDLVFTNNQATPIYIQGYVSGDRLYFHIYGQETRPENRTLEFNSVTVSKKTYPDKTVESSSYPVGYKKSTGSHHPAVTSYLEKIVYVDGNEVSRERISYDVYEGSFVTTVIGTKQTAPPPAENEQVWEAVE